MRTGAARGRVERGVRLLNGLEEEEVVQRQARYVWLQWCALRVRQVSRERQLVCAVAVHGDEQYAPVVVRDGLISGRWGGGVMGRHP